MEKNILILKDDRTGNFGQAQAVGNIVTSYLKKRDIESRIDIQEIKFRSKFAKSVLIFISAVAGKYIKGCHWCLRIFLKPEVYRSLVVKKPDVIISGGFSLAVVNAILSKEKLAKSIVVMKPPTLSLSSFNLAIIPRHDNPPKRENIVVTEGSLNLIDQDYLEKQTKALLSSSIIGSLSSGLCIGLLIGGDAKSFHLAAKDVSEVIKQIKSVLQNLGGDILVTTSRRTPADIEELVKKEFMGYDHCKLLVIANEKNIPETVGAILGLSEIVVISPESIMMISEAVNSKKYVLTFESEGLSRKHKRFLHYFAKNKYIYLTAPSGLGQMIRDIKLNKPEVHIPSKNNLLITEALSKIL